VLLRVARQCKQIQAVTMGCQSFQAARKQHGAFGICSRRNRAPPDASTLLPAGYLIPRPGGKLGACQIGSASSNTRLSLTAEASRSNSSIGPVSISIGMTFRPADLGHSEGSSGPPRVGLR
jgi:hypothetical protein